MGMMRYFQAWEGWPCKEALHENIESNWTDACSESLFVMTWGNICYVTRFSFLANKISIDPLDLS